MAAFRRKKDATNATNATNAQEEDQVLDRSPWHQPTPEVSDIDFFQALHAPTAEAMPFSGPLGVVPQTSPASFGQTATPNVMQGRLPFDPSDMFDAYNMSHEPVDRRTQQPGGAYERRPTLSKFDNWFLHPTTQIGLAMASPGGNPAAAGASAAKARADLLQEPFLQDQAAQNILKTRAEVGDISLKRLAAQQQAELAQKNKQFDQVQKVRADIVKNPVSKELEGSRRAVDYLKTRGIDKGEAISGQDAIALIIDFYKIKDPNSAVLGGEVQTGGAESEGFKAQLGAFLRSFSGVATLTKDQVHNLYNLIQGSYDQKLQQYNQVLGSYEPFVSDYGLGWDQIDVHRGMFEESYNDNPNRLSTGVFSNIAPGGKVLKDEFGITRRTPDGRPLVGKGVNMNYHNRSTAGREESARRAGEEAAREAKLYGISTAEGVAKGFLDREETPPKPRPKYRAGAGAIE